MKKVTHLTLIFLMLIVLLIVIWRDVRVETVMNNIKYSVKDLEPTIFSTEQLNNLPGVSINYLHVNNSSNTIDYELINSTNDTLYYGDGVILEKNIKEKWYKMPYSGDIGFVAILNYLSPFDTSEIRIPMGAWKTVTSGDYRIILEVSNEEDLNNLYPISAYFTIDK
ncbi:MAG: hypothetical protein Q7I98_01855 [Erysipelotrichaceae bacterium]|nr:hypothetical protein [Erysipelotrichaceae bacterium]